MQDVNQIGVEMKDDTEDHPQLTVGELMKQINVQKVMLEMTGELESEFRVKRDNVEAEEKAAEKEGKVNQWLHYQAKRNTVIFNALESYKGLLTESIENITRMVDIMNFMQDEKDVEL